MSALATRRAFELESQAPEHRWLVEGLWAKQAVGIVGGEPKSCKSFLALDMAVAVASGRPCLRRFAVKRRGRVLLFAAEDALHVVRGRLEGIAKAAGASFDTLDVHVITAPTVRLDLEADQQRLSETIRRLAPTLLVLDPFVRLHRIDENASQYVAPLLAYLRQLQRRFEMAVLLVHHARKGGHVRPGQALRGSSELHAWGDSNLYLRRQRDRLQLSIEHRAAPGREGLALELDVHDDQVALRVLDEALPATSPAHSVAERVEQALARAPHPLDRRALRAACRMRMTTLLRTLSDLTAAGRVTEREGRFRLVR